jgi:hypothetical protein
LFEIFIVFSVIKILVPSANNTLVKQLMCLGKSFEQILKSSDPKTNSCGTPHLTISHVEE